MNRFIQQSCLHGPSCHPFRDLARSSGLPPIIGRWIRRYLFAPSRKKRLLPFHLSFPYGFAVVSGLKRSHESITNYDVIGRVFVYPDAACSATADIGPRTSSHSSRASELIASAQGGVPFRDARDGAANDCHAKAEDAVWYERYFQEPGVAEAEYDRNVRTVFASAR